MSQETTEPGGLIGGDLNKLQEYLNTSYTNQRKEIQEKIGVLGGYMQNSALMAAHRTEFYRYRQQLVGAKLSLSALGCKLGVRRKNDKKVAYARSRSNGTADAPKNDVERNIFYEYELRDLEYVIEITDHQLEYVIDSIKTMDNMIYGFNLVANMENLNNNYGS